MNFIAFVIAFIALAFIGAVSAIAVHLFRDKWISYVAFFVTVSMFFLALPIAVAVGYEFGGN